MLVISPAQQQSFRNVARARFESDMVKHLTLRSAFHAQVLGDAGMRAAVHFGIDRAAARGYTRRGPVRLWLQLMFLSGGYFDDDPLLPAAAAPFINCDDPDREMILAERLHATHCEVLARISGAANLHHRKALVRLNTLVLHWPHITELEEQLLDDFFWIHPQKIEILGEAAHRRLITAAVAQAQALGVGTPSGTALFPVLAFTLGAGFARDPLYPWISSILYDPPSMSPDQRAARLERQVRTYLRQVLDNLRTA